MRENRGQDIVRNRHQRKERVKRIKILLAALGIAVTGFLIYFVGNVITLLTNMEHMGTVSEYSDSSYDFAATYDSIKNEATTLEMERQFDALVADIPREISDSVKEKIIAFAVVNGISIDEYPKELIELLEKNSETEEFVLNYPLKKEEVSYEPLYQLMEDSEIYSKDIEDMPLLLQWDERWGYFQYGDNVLGLTGCGPTCLSMVASFLLDNPEFTPRYMAEYSIGNGYCVEGFGSSWELMSTGAEALGLNVREVPLSEDFVRQYLEDGMPIICIMGEGIFTDNGHYIVFKGWKDGKIMINDSNSKANSEKLWSFDEIQGQIKNMWVYW